ncbi:unnamed protein product [Medioppia subpectinata]|uniref:Uncharacterized protein n=1 Tax=Medioppia subpectinata TaxID=1979941 RepID=A0A7R9KSB0_9ACAR|nr:unnamed protein product [Medioppia subpectinata]CAG2107542.1 unnamed protein product [Medioppia subpectinata]
MSFFWKSKHNKQKKLYHRRDNSLNVYHYLTFGRNKDVSVIEPSDKQFVCRQKNKKKQLTATLIRNQFECIFYVLGEVVEDCERVSVTGHQGMGPLGISVAHDQLNSWQIFGVEFVLTFLVVFTIFATLDPNRKSLGSDSLSIGIAYLVCSLTGSE